MPTVSIKNTEQNRSWETPTSEPTRYMHLDQYIGGVWRRGKEDSKLIDADPFTGEQLTEIVQANKADSGDAYQSAAKAQVSWAPRTPAQRAAIMLRSSHIMEAFRSHVDRKDLSFKTARK